MGIEKEMGALVIEPHLLHLLVDNHTSSIKSPLSSSTTMNPSSQNQESSDLISTITTLLRSSYPSPFPSAWSLILSSPSSPLPFSSFLPLIRLYSRHRLPSAALRTHNFCLSHHHSSEVDDPFDALIDSLIKENLTPHAAAYVAHRSSSSSDPHWSPSIRCYNMLLHAKNSSGGGRRGAHWVGGRGVKLGGGEAQVWQGISAVVARERAWHG